MEISNSSKNIFGHTKINDFQQEAERKNQIKTRIFLYKIFITRFFSERRCFVCL